MAQKPTQPTRPELTAEELVAQLDRSRLEIGAQAGTLTDSLNPSHQIRRSIQEHPERWIIGGVVGGVIGARMLFSSRRGRKSGKHGVRLPVAAMIGMLARTAFVLARPAATRLVQKRLEQLVD